MKFLALLKRASPKTFFLALVVSILAGVSSTYVIRLIHQYINGGLGESHVFFTEFILSVLSFGVFGVLSSYFISLLTQAMIFDLRIELSKKILNASFQKTERKLDKILPVLSADINFVSASMNRLPPVVTGLATAVGCLIYLFYLSWQLTLGCMVIFSVGFLINYLALPYLKKYSEKARNEWDKIHKDFEGIVMGMKELKLNQGHRENFIHTSLEPNCLKERQYRVKEETLYAVSARVVEVILFMGIGVFIYAIDYMPAVTKESFGDYLLVLLFTVAPLATVSGFLKHIKRTQISLSKIEQIGISLEVESTTQEVRVDLSSWKPMSQPLFCFINVEFNYGADESFSIGPLNMEVNRGEIVYIVGGNGSGKTTFIKLLTGLYQATRGEIRFKNQQIDDVLLDFYRKHFAGVFTDYHLFDDLQHISDQMLGKAEGLLQQLEIDHKVKVVDRKISTTRLSYGQRKRLAMMIAILEDKEVYIFDEWAANQDPYFKEIFYTSLLPQLKQAGKTIVAISHDEKYFDLADSVFKMDEGTLKPIITQKNVLSS